MIGPDGAYSIEPFRTADEIAARNETLAADIRARIGTADDVVIVGVLRGSFVFIADLIRALHRNGISPRIDFMTLARYGNADTSADDVSVVKGMSGGIAGMRVLLVDDILDTGRTLTFAKNHCLALNAASVSSIVLLDKPSRRIIDIHADFIGFTIDDRFAVGYGLDYANRHRELPYLGIVSFGD
ncbi:MAG: hypoxanthine phosphoribosyltransferase [Spirochaetota bacterium]